MVCHNWSGSGSSPAGQVEQTRVRAKGVCFTPDDHTVRGWNRPTRKEHEGGRANGMRRMERGIFRPARGRGNSACCPHLVTPGHRMYDPNSVLARCFLQGSRRVFCGCGGTGRRAGFRIYRTPGLIGLTVKAVAKEAAAVREIEPGSQSRLAIQKFPRVAKWLHATNLWFRLQ